MRLFRFLGACGLPVLVAVAAGSCSANSSDNSFSAKAGSGGSGVGGSGASTFGGSGGSGAGGNGGALIDSGMGDGALTEASACAAEKYPGDLVPLDIYVLLDATASMDGAQGTPVVWPDVTQALVDFASDTLSEGIGLGLTFMPKEPSTAVPSSCTTVTDCGLYGPCLNLGVSKVCSGSLAPKVSCDPVDYGGPDVPIAALPGNKAAFVSAIQGKDPDGDATPTQPALIGSLAYAQQWATDNPTHLTYVLFATDGLPNNCTTNSIKGAAEAAKAAFEGNPSVPTYVLGIGDYSDLNTIASAGGTTEAYIADSTDVAQKMVQMFNEIRANGACKFQIPTPAAGGQPNYENVFVSYTPLGSSTEVEVPYVGDESHCDATKGGWYFDDITQAHPTKILLCPATCDQVKLSEEGVSVMLACKPHQVL